MYVLKGLSLIGIVLCLFLMAKKTKEMAASERVYVNGRIAKPSTIVKVGDEIRVIFGHREILVRVLMLAKQVNKNDAALMFEVLEEKQIEQEL